jgi:hypothetical protein
LEKLLQENISSPDVLDAIFQLIQKDKEESLKASLHTLPEELQGTGIVPSIAPVAEEPMRKRCKVAGNHQVILSRNYQLECQQHQGKNKENKLSVCQIFVEAVKEAKQQLLNDGKVLVQPLKSWLYRAGKVVQCIETCHQGSIEEFVEANTGIALSKFTVCSCGIEHNAVFAQAKK